MVLFPSLQVGRIHYGPFGPRAAVCSCFCPIYKLRVFIASFLCEQTPRPILHGPIHTKNRHVASIKIKINRPNNTKTLYPDNKPVYDYHSTYIFRSDIFANFRTTRPYTIPSQLCPNNSRLLLIFAFLPRRTGKCQLSRHVGVSIYIYCLTWAYVRLHSSAPIVWRCPRSWNAVLEGLHPRNVYQFLSVYVGLDWRQSFFSRIIPHSVV